VLVPCCLLLLRRLRRGLPRGGHRLLYHLQRLHPITCWLRGRLCARQLRRVQLCRIAGRLRVAACWRPRRSSLLLLPAAARSVPLIDRCTLLLLLLLLTFPSRWRKAGRIRCRPLSRAAATPAGAGGGAAPRQQPPQRGALRLIQALPGLEVQNVPQAGQRKDAGWEGDP
jgi:hypothetical protein